MRGRLKLVALVVDATDDRLAAIAGAGEARFLPTAWQRDVRAHGGYPRAVSACPSSRRLPVAEPPISPARPTMTMSPTCCCSMPRPPRGADAPGGHGAAFDWQILRGRQLSPALVAGRRAHSGQCRARHRTSAARQMVDVSSGVESAPGVKEPTAASPISSRRPEHAR